MLMVALALLLSSASAYAQESICKSKATIRVAYPEIARRMKIAGIVRLKLELTPSGSVRESKVIGGNPVLASAAQAAAKQAKFEGGESCVAVFEFKD
jgi:TonB family protein